MDPGVDPAITCAGSSNILGWILRLPWFNPATIMAGLEGGGRFVKIYYRNLGTTGVHIPAYNVCVPTF